MWHKHERVMNKIKKCLIPLFSLMVLSCSSMNAERHEALPALNKRVDFAALPICYNHGCTQKHLISVSQPTRASIKEMFVTVSNPQEERWAIRKAVALLEQEAAKFTPVGIDQKKNTNLDEEGRQDCVDESTNTSHFLALLHQQQLLQFHRVAPRVYRAHFLLDQHYAAQIIDTLNGKHFVVDSWFLGNGELPYIQPYKRWAMKRSFLPENNP